MKNDRVNLKYQFLIMCLSISVVTCISAMDNSHPHKESLNAVSHQVNHASPNKQKNDQNKKYCNKGCLSRFKNRAANFCRKHSDKIHLAAGICVGAELMFIKNRIQTGQTDLQEVPYWP